jgi:broad specificity phosphatase PhoE
MSKELAVLVIHGMGSQAPDYAEEAIEEINERIADGGKDPGAVAWGTVYWQDILQPRQRKYLRDARRGNDLDFVSLREFVVEAFGDAAAYQRTDGSSGSTYQQVHDRVAEAVKRIYTEDLAGSAVPLVVMAHSLGSHIMSNYIWDMQQGNVDRRGLSAFEKMETLAGLITFGCNIPLFTFAHEQVAPIDFPAPQLPEAVKRKAKWLNFYDPDDVLGYPLKPLSSAYRAVVDKDIAINVGSILTSWNPMSHGEYWIDNDFTKPVSRFLASLL